MNTFKPLPALNLNHSPRNNQLLSDNPFRANHLPKQVAPPKGLVVSADSSVRSALGETLLLCGATPVLAASIREASQRIRCGHLRLGVCQDRLPDGKYEELLLLSRETEIPFPWIVVSRTGDWPEYLAAIDLGAHDFLAYPPIRGELPRIIRALLETPITPGASAART
jgi:DNA-binding NtrC family response regulator